MVFAFETYQINDDDFLKVGQFKGKLQFYSLISTSPRIVLHLVRFNVDVVTGIFLLFEIFFGGGGPK